MPLNKFPNTWPIPTPRAYQNWFPFLR